MRSIDEKEFWEKFEEVVEGAVKRAKAEELRDVTDAIKMLAEHMKTGFKKTFQILLEYSRRFDEVSRRIEKYSKKIEELTKRVKKPAKAVLEVKVTVGSTTKRLGLDLEKTVLNLYRDTLP